MYDSSLIGLMNKKAYTLKRNKTEVIIKPIPDCDIKGESDPRLKDAMFSTELPKDKTDENIFKKVIGLFKNLIFGIKLYLGNVKLGENEVAILRKMFNEVKAEKGSFSGDIAVEEIKADGVPIRIYRSDIQQSEATPVLMYIHGGGFIAGSMDVVDELCRSMAERIGCIVVSVGYRIAPENRFPAQIDDCMAVLKWICQNADYISADAGRIYVAGDSAGGNLAAACAIKDSQKEKPAIKAMVLAYPTLILTKEKPYGYEFNIGDFEFSKGNKKMLLPMIKIMQRNMYKIGGLIFAPNLADELISPYNVQRPQKLPPALILCGEHDYLRVESELFAAELKKAGNDCRCV